jgi:hypothetical protein
MAAILNPLTVKATGEMNFPAREQGSRYFH